MGSALAQTRPPGRRLKFTSVQRLESARDCAEMPEAASSRAPLVAIGETFVSAYVSVTRRVLLGLEAFQDGRALRRAETHRGRARRSSFPNARSNLER
jgi:hypothetical protein